MISTTDRGASSVSLSDDLREQRDILAAAAHSAELGTLNTQTFNPVGVGEPGDLIDQPPAVERRRALRHPLYLRITCRTLEMCGGMSWPASVKDISTKGIGLLLCRPFGPGTILSVELPDSESVVGWSLTLRVVHSRKVGDGQWLAGCVFATQLEAAPLDNWVTSFPREIFPPPAKAPASRGKWLLVILFLCVLLGAIGAWALVQAFGLAG